MSQKDTRKKTTTVSRFTKNPKTYLLYKSNNAQCTLKSVLSLKTVNKQLGVPNFVLRLACVAGTGPVACKTFALKAIVRASNSI